MSQSPITINPNYSTTRLCCKLLTGNYLGKNGRIKDELKFKINIPAFNIKNSKIIGKPEDKFETMLFLPEGEGRKGEGGLRTKGYFKHSCKRVTSNKVTSDGQKIEEWRICDTDENPVKKAPEDFENKINSSLITHHSSGVTDLSLISIITVVYNGEKYLEETIQSVINQTYPNVEYIIIDGGSTDGTLDIIKKYENKIDYWVSEKDEGIYDAMNKGIDLATGEWVYFLGADDILCREVLKQIYFDSNFDRKYLAIYGDVYMPKKHKLYNGKFNKYKIMFCNICHQAIFYNSKVFKQNKFNEKYKIWADYDLNMRIFDEANFMYKPILVAFFNDLSGISSLVKNDEIFQNERAAIIKKYLGKKYYYVYILRNFFKKIYLSAINFLKVF